MQQIFTFTGPRQIDAAGNFVRYDRETFGALDDSIRVRVNGQDCGVWRPGDAAEFPEKVTRVEITPTTTAQGEIRVGLGRFNTSRTQLSGQVNSTIVANRAPIAAFTNTQRTVTNASQALMGANPSRQYLLVQNNHPSGFIWVAFGAAATQANGVRIGPGGFWEWDSTIPNGTVNFIGDLATQSSVVTVEGQ